MANYTLVVLASYGSAFMSIIMARIFQLKVVDHLNLFTSKLVYLKKPLTYEKNNLNLATVSDISKIV